jgi:acyl-coenzyme A thioesterase PaaI-like protein
MKGPRVSLDLGGGRFDHGEMEIAKKESLTTRLFRLGMNLYPMYAGTGGKVKFISSDWHHARVELRLRLKTRNYAGTIFGGAMFAAIDPFHMVLLMNILGKENFVVWDKAGAIQFKKPGRGRIVCDVRYEIDEVEKIRAEASANGKYEFVKSAEWIDEKGDVVALVQKTVYVATKEYYRERKRLHAAKSGLT